MNREQLHGTFAILTHERRDEIEAIVDVATSASAGKSSFSLSVAGAYLLMSAISGAHSKAPKQLSLCLDQGEYARELLNWVIDVFDEIEDTRKQSN